MKKNGFTLAEVLITLAIIGVVATMTLPTLITNTGEQQAKTGLKKGINTLTEAIQMNHAIEGISYADITSNEDDPAKAEGDSLLGILINRASVDLQNSAKGAASPVNAGATDNYALFFRDGSAISFNASSSNNANNKELEDDNIVNGFGIIYDTNGAKGPNVLSNCEGKVGLTAKEMTGNGGDQCDSKSQRVIKDQFAIRLRGTIVVPNNPAARWALEN